MQFASKELCPSPIVTSVISLEFGKGILKVIIFWQGLLHLWWLTLKALFTLKACSPKVLANNPEELNGIPSKVHVILAMLGLHRVPKISRRSGECCEGWAICFLWSTHTIFWQSRGDIICLHWSIFRDVLFLKAFGEPPEEGRVLSQFLPKLCESE